MKCKMRYGDEVVAVSTVTIAAAHSTNNEERRNGSMRDVEKSRSVGISSRIWPETADVGHH